MSLTKQFATDENIEISGIEVKYGKNADGSVPTFVICRQGGSNKKYFKVLDRVTKPVRRQMDLGTLDDEESKDLMMDVFYESVMKPWSNILLSDVTGDENDVGYAPYNRENVKMLFKRLPEIYNDLTQKSQTVALFRIEAQEAEVKN
jgi:hypothetical protein